MEKIDLIELLEKEHLQNNEEKINIEKSDIFIQKIISNYKNNYNTFFFVIINYILKFSGKFNGYVTKEDVLQELSTYYTEEKIKIAFSNFKIYSMFEKKILNLNEEERKVIIKDFIENSSSSSQNDLQEIKQNIENAKEIYIENKIDDFRNELIYIFDTGFITVFNIDNETYKSKKYMKNPKQYEIIKFFIENSTVNNEGTKIKVIFENKEKYLNQDMLNVIKTIIHCDVDKSYEEIFVNIVNEYILQRKIELVAACTDILLKFENINKDEILKIADLLEHTDYREKTIKIYKNLIEKGEIKLYPKLIEIFAYSNQKENAIEYLKRAKEIDNTELKQQLFEIEQDYYLNEPKEYNNNYDINDIIKKLKEKYIKRGAEINIIDGEPDIKDSKLGGIPFLPIGEKIPCDFQNREMLLLIQINLKEIELENYPSSGILEIFVDNNLQQAVIRYYENTDIEYQQNLESQNNTIILKSKKIEFKLKDIYLPSSNYRFNEFLEENRINDYDNISMKYNEDISNPVAIFGGYGKFIGNGDPDNQKFS